jgi:hypothetical protein
MHKWTIIENANLWSVFETLALVVLGHCSCIQERSEQCPITTGTGVSNTLYVIFDLSPRTRSCAVFSSFGNQWSSNEGVLGTRTGVSNTKILRNIHNGNGEWICTWLTYTRECDSGKINLRMESCQLLSTTMQDPIIYHLLVLY